MDEAYRFGAIEIRPASRELLVGGAAAAIGGRAFDVLVALVERRDRVVTKNELLDLAWPGLVVEENNLQAQVSSLRRVLGAKAIATIPGRGYRFTLSEDTSLRTAMPATASTKFDELRRGMPRLSNALLGREDELAALDRLLDQHRLVTIAGAGGIGKTSLAVAAAEQRLPKMRDGILWVDLAPIRDPALVPAAVAKALQVQAAPGADVTPSLLAAVGTLQLLVVIDTAEHVLDAVAQLVEAMLAAPDVKMLVTSRSTLKLKVERVMRLAPLGIPDPGVGIDEARAFGAIALLDERVKALDPRFALGDGNLGYAIEVCRHLDGIALAIELAAARVPVLGMARLAERIGQRFRMLSSSSPTLPTRQQTLQAALDWSYELLSPDEQKAFRRLAVFPSDFSLEIATAVVGDEAVDEWGAIDAIAALVDHSLVEVDAGSVPRYRLLETARAYAALRNSPEETRSAQRALADALLELFEKAEIESWSWTESEWLAAYGRELESMRAALDWTMANERALAIALLGASRALHSVQGLDFELRMRCERIEPGRDVVVPPAVEGRYWLARAMALRQFNRERSLACSRKAAELFRAVANDMMVYVALCMASFNEAIEVARETMREVSSIERAEWPPRVKFWAVLAGSNVAIRDCELRRAESLLEVGVQYARQCDSDLMLRRALGNVADLALALGDVDKAVRLGREVVARIPERQYPALVVRGNFITALLQAGELEEARGVLISWIRLARAAQWDTFPTFALVLPLLAAREGRFESAARMLGYARRRADEGGGNIEANEEKAYDVALQLTGRELGPAALKRLMEQGALLDEEAVCALALERETVST